MREQQLILFVHNSLQLTVLALSEQNVFFVWMSISAEQILSHQFFYINDILVQSHEILVNSLCIQYAEWDFSLFMKCCKMSDHFNDICTNCKWHDHAVWYSVWNSDESWHDYNALLSSSSFFLIHIILENHWLSDSESWSSSDSILNNVIVLI